MSNKVLYIVDIRCKQKINPFLNLLDGERQILALTPYSMYLLEDMNKKYITFHDIESIEIFIKNTLMGYEDMETFFSEFPDFQFLFRDIAFLLTYEQYIKVLFDYIKEKHKNGFNIIYVTDVREVEEESFNMYRQSYVRKCQYINQIIDISIKDKFFYKMKKVKLLYVKLLYTNNIISKFYDKYIKRNKKSLQLSYDNVHYKNIYNNQKACNLKQNELFLPRLNNFIESFEIEILQKKEIAFFQKQYRYILQHLQKTYLSLSKTQKVKQHPFTFLGSMQKYAEVLLYKENNIPLIFMQHGSYLQENIFLKYNEIYPADINFVVNDFTKNLFERRETSKVYSVGSIDFNYPILDIEKKYDFTYITYCTSYSYPATIISSRHNLLAMDANNIYQRHKKVIELFGTKFKDKKICIKIQPGIMTGDMLYVPFLELSKNYPNITIEFSIPIQKLIPKSKYIISDYFSSEFINKELHYKRDIILFQNSPLSLPVKTLEDMKKMFILVDSVDDLEEKIKNIEKITKDRKRYDDIIEYYSSKKCDTKKVVTEILEKELNARN